MSSFIDTIILFLLGLDSIRMVISFLGIVKPTAKYAWLIYGRYDVNLVERALIQLGYNCNDAKVITKNISDIRQGVIENHGINKENACGKLIVLLSRYIDRFECPINYGGNSISQSSFYINTMALSHDTDDLNELVSIMLHLMRSNLEKDPDFIIVPKGGNLFFAREVSKYYKADLVVVKEEEDKSTVTSSVQTDSEKVFKVNFEGIGPVLEKSKKSDSTLTGCLIDCNISGGTQLLSSLKKINRMIDECNLNIEKPKKAFILFRADMDRKDIDQQFNDLNCALYRYFDLDEESKNMIWKAITDGKVVEESIDDKKNKILDYYVGEDKEKIKSIINYLKEKKYFYYGGLNSEH